MKVTRTFWIIALLVVAAIAGCGKAATNTPEAGDEIPVVARTDKLLPLGLADGARLTQAVSQGAAITYDQVELEDSFAVTLRRLQDATVW